MIPTAEGMELDWIVDAPAKWQVLKQGVDFYKENREILLYGVMENYYQFAQGGKKVIFGDLVRQCPGVICAIYTYEGARYTMLYNYAEDTQQVNVEGQMFCVPGKSFLKVKK